MGPLIWYVNAQVRMWIILDINYKHYYHLGKSHICAGAGDYFRTSKPHSEKLWDVNQIEDSKNSCLVQNKLEKWSMVE